MKILPTASLLTALATPTIAEAQHQNTLTAFYRNTWTSADPNTGVGSGLVNAQGFHAIFDRKFSGVVGLFAENVLMTVPEAPFLPFSSNLSTLPGAIRSSDGALNVSDASQSSRNNLTEQFLLNLYWFPSPTEGIRVGLFGALGMGYTHTINTYHIHIPASAARPGDTVRVAESYHDVTSENYRSEFQARFGGRAQYTSGLLTFRAEVFYHLTARLDGNGADDGDNLVGRLSVNFAPKIGPVRFPFDFRFTETMRRRGSDHLYIFDPTLELRLGAAVEF